MTINELEKKLNKALKDFSDEICSEYSDYNKDPVVGGDIANLSRQTFYALNEFKKEIINYLKSNN